MASWKTKLRRVSCRGSVLRTPSSLRVLAMSTRGEPWVVDEAVDDDAGVQILHEGRCVHPTNSTGDVFQDRWRTPPAPRGAPCTPDGGGSGMDAKEGHKYWHARAPWLYKSVTVHQLDGRCPSIDVDEAASGRDGSVRLLTTTNTWPVAPAGGAAANVPQAAVLALDVTVPAPGAPIVEFDEGDLGRARYSNRVTFNAAILRARCLRKETNLSVVKLMDSVVLADLQTHSVRQAPFHLQTKQATKQRNKSAALACQPKGAVAAFTDYGAGTDLDRQGLHLWDVTRPPPAPQHRNAAYTCEGKIEDLCFCEHDNTTIYCVSDNGYVRTLDTRVGAGGGGSQGAGSAVTKECVAPYSGHQKCVAASKADANILITGGKDGGKDAAQRSGGVLVWDLRMPRGHLVGFDHAGADVTHVATHPTDPALIASATQGQVWVWDLFLSAAGADATGGDDDVPPELQFVHPAHHPYPLTGLVWVPSLRHTLVSTDGGGALHMFSPGVLHADDEELAVRKAHGLTTSKGELKEVKGK